MFVAYTAVALLLSLFLVFSGRTKLVRDDRVTAAMDRVEVPSSWFAPLAALEFAGALGLLVGIFYRPLGIAAAVGVVLYFTGAVIAHLRVKDFKGIPVPAALLVFAAVSLALGAASA